MPETLDRGSGSSTHASENSATVDSSFPIASSARLIIENPRGSIRVVGADRQDIHVHATKRLDSSVARYEATRIELQQYGDTVIARTVLDPTARFVERGTVPGIAGDVLRAFTDLLQTTTKPAAVDYLLEVPRRCDLELNGVSSDVVVESARGALRLRSVSGSLDLGNVAGELDLGTVSGEIRSKGLTGRAQIESVSGAIRLTGDLAALRAKTVSGDVEMNGPLAASGTYEFRSVSGDITLGVPIDTGATITVKGVSSDVSSELPCTVTRDERHPGSRAWQGQINGGGATVSLQTVSGNLQLRPIATPAPTEADDNSLTIPPASDLTTATTNSPENELELPPPETAPV